MSEKYPGCVSPENATPFKDLAIADQPLFSEVYPTPTEKELVALGRTREGKVYGLTRLIVRKPEEAAPEVRFVWVPMVEHLRSPLRGAL